MTSKHFLDKSPEERQTLLARAGVEACAVMEELSQMLVRVAALPWNPHRIDAQELLALAGRAVNRANNEYMDQAFGPVDWESGAKPGIFVECDRHLDQ